MWMGWVCWLRLAEVRASKGRKGRKEESSPQLELAAFLRPAPRRRLSCWDRSVGRRSYHVGTLLVFPPKPIFFRCPYRLAMLAPACASSPRSALPPFLSLHPCLPQDAPPPNKSSLTFYPLLFA